jgi:pimeloyl-ACP methyl ester carboxylesterase
VVVERGTALTNNPAAPRLGFAFASTEGKMIKKTGMGVVLAVLLMASPAATLSQTGAVAAVADKTLAVFGQNIHYWDAGSGPVVVLVHGLGSRKEGDWGRVFEPLSKKYRVIALDQLGFGQSDKPVIDYSIQTYVDFLNEFLHQLKIEKASLMGESLGGWISASYTMEAANDSKMVPVEKLVLSDAAGLKQDKPIPDLNPSTLAGMRHVLEVVFYNTSWINDELIRHELTERIRANISYTVHSILTNPALPKELLDGKLGGIHVPTLVVWGKQDALLPVESGERYVKEIPGAKLITFDQCGHVPPREKAPEFVSAVEMFLDAPANAH